MLSLIWMQCSLSIVRNYREYDFQLRDWVEIIYSDLFRMLVHPRCTPMLVCHTFCVQGPKLQFLLPRIHCGQASAGVTLVLEKSRFIVFLVCGVKTQRRLDYRSLYDKRAHELRHRRKSSLISLKNWLKGPCRKTIKTSFPLQPVLLLQQLWIQDVRAPVFEWRWHEPKHPNLSLFFVVMRGQYDALLCWPFRQTVTLMLLDQDKVEHVIDAFRPDLRSNRPFAGSGHMVWNKFHWDANNAMGLPKQRNSYKSSPTFLCFGTPTASFASQSNLFRTMWPDPAKGLFVSKTKKRNEYRQWLPYPKYHIETKFDMNQSLWWLKITWPAWCDRDLCVR